MLRSLPVTLLVLAAVACQPTGTAGSAGWATLAAPEAANATFTIDKDTVKLSNGRAEREAAPGSATKVVTTLSDKRATGDVDGDGRPDAVVILTYQPGATGTFSYVAALLNSSSGLTATPAVLLGDRITVSAVRLDGRTIVVELLDRSSGQPLTSSPTLSVAKRFTVTNATMQPQ